ncbi:uncharacterized protein V1518DRAFT_423331, partial [Limtongia smithiae]|uniref:uncharacterized protein n=1 Tax=Limtongia smithiae TaxID=1125753 RepID=UPI0034CD32FF
MASPHNYPPSSPPVPTGTASPLLAPTAPSTAPLARRSLLPSFDLAPAANVSPSRGTSSTRGSPIRKRARADSDDGHAGGTPSSRTSGLRARSLAERRGRSARAVSPTPARRVRSVAGTAADASANATRGGMVTDNDSAGSDDEDIDDKRARLRAYLWEHNGDGSRRAQHAAETAVATASAARYPTPAPTSSASLTISSPSSSAVAVLIAMPRSGVLQDAPPTAAESEVQDENDENQCILRSPLSTVVLARVPRSGETVSLGRSSASSTVVLSRTNKLISRVHVSTRYVCERDTIEIKCLGWNGARVGTPTEEHRLAKGETVEIPADVNVIVDVCGERARVEVYYDAAVDDDETDDDVFSAEREERKPAAVDFKVWEDKEEAAPAAQPVPVQQEMPGSPESMSSLSEEVVDEIKRPSPEIEQPEHEEPEQDHLAIQADIPNDLDLEKLTTHLIAHLAYSRLASTPFSVLRASIPAANKLSEPALRSVIRNIPCIGQIKRQGKDASGKRLEEQYYYVIEEDDDEHRRAAVDELRGHAGIRSCRKVHKQYFWRKPSGI